MRTCAKYTNRTGAQIYLLTKQNIVRAPRWGDGANRPSSLHRRSSARPAARGLRSELSAHDILTQFSHAIGDGEY